MQLFGTRSLNEQDPVDSRVRMRMPEGKRPPCVDEKTGLVKFSSRIDWYCNKALPPICMLFHVCWMAYMSITQIIECVCSLCVLLMLSQPGPRGPPGFPPPQHQGLR